MPDSDSNSAWPGILSDPNGALSPPTANLRDAYGWPIVGGILDTGGGPRSVADMLRPAPPWGLGAFGSVNPQQTSSGSSSTATQQPGTSDLFARNIATPSATQSGAGKPAATGSASGRGIPSDPDGACGLSVPAFIDPQAWQDLHDLALNGDPDAVEDMLRLPPAATNGSASFPTGFGNLSSAFGRSQIVPVSARVPQQQTSFNINDPANGGSLNSQIVTGAHTAAPPPPAVPHQPPMSSQVRNPAGPGIYAQRPTPYDEAPHATSDFLQPLSPSSNGGWNQPAAQLSDPTASPDLSGVTVTGGGAQRIADMLRLPSATGALSGSAVVQQAPGPNGSMTSQPVSADAIDAYLRSKNSPLVGEGADFMKWGQAYDLDPRLLVALAGSETTFGKKITRGDNNALNVLYNGPHSDFESVDHAIKGAAKSLNKPGSTYDLSNTASMYPDHYCRGKGCTDGLKNLNNFMREQGGDPNALHYPRKP